ncbi:MAG: alpha/beta hydrolase [Verrucomicrobiota bacterium]
MKRPQLGLTVFNCLAACTFLSTIAKAEPLAPQLLWSKGVPGETDLKLPDESLELRGDYRIEILSNVSHPTLTWYQAPQSNGTAVIVCPGGGYNILAYSHEGKEVCKWLNSIGISAALVKYRVPRRESLEKHHAPLQDIQRAIGIVRTNAVKWNVNPQRIGVLGFSAGGHLCTMALTSDGSRTYQEDPAWDAPSCIPNFGILVYPAYQLDEEDPDRLSPEIAVDENTPPAFLVVGHEDKKWTEGSARFYIEMKRHDRSCELHIFAKGGHGFGFGNTVEEIKQWPQLAENWMQAMGWLGE